MILQLEPTRSGVMCWPGVPRCPVDLQNGIRDGASDPGLRVELPMIGVRRRGNPRPPDKPGSTPPRTGAAAGREAPRAAGPDASLAAEPDAGAAAGPGPDVVRREEAALVERSRVDPEAFGELYDRYCDRIYRFVYRRLNDRESAEDVTAEVFFKALRAIDSYRSSTAPFGAWLYRIASNAITDHVRARRETVSLDHAADAVDRANPVDEQAISRVEAARVWEAIDLLTDAQRVAVTLRLGHDLPIADIAARLDRSEGAVKLLLNRGLSAVRGHLQQAPGGQEAQR